MAEPFIGEIRVFGFDFNPRFWVKCEGQTIPVRDNQALFALLGNRFGGDGINDFGIPDLRGRKPIGYGYAPGLQPYQLGQSGGYESIPLHSSQVPTHDHPATATINVAAKCTNAVGDSTEPEGKIPAKSSEGDKIYAGADPDKDLKDSAIEASATVTVENNQGGGLAHENRSPYLAISYCMATQGVFPSRN